MEQRILQDSPPDERRKLLAANAYKVDPKYTYTRELEEGELRERQNGLSQNLIKIDRADQVLKEAKESYNAVVKPLREENKMALTEIRTRSEEITGDVYLMKDEHTGQMGIYSPEGILLMQRGLLPEERQFSIIDNSELRKIN